MLLRFSDIYVLSQFWNMTKFENWIFNIQYSLIFVMIFYKKKFNCSKLRKMAQKILWPIRNLFSQIWAVEKKSLKDHIQNSSYLKIGRWDSKAIKCECHFMVSFVLFSVWRCCDSHGGTTWSCASFTLFTGTVFPKRASTHQKWIS